MARMSKAGGNMRMIAGVMGALQQALSEKFNYKNSLAGSGKGGKPSYNNRTGSFKQNRRKELKRSWCKKVKSF